MKLKFPVIAAFTAMLALSACGGGSNDDAGGKTSVTSPATLTKTDNTVGTGAEAMAGKRATVDYTLWLYDASKSDFKGEQKDAGKGLQFVVGGQSVITGFDQGVAGMKVGGKRTVLVPSALGYGVAGSRGIPGNSGLVFEVILTKVE
jgi:FKBP-type peptidyl-prolyl cis-trans isomerase FkpA